MASAIFSTTWINIRIRCCQILYWPIFLQENDLRSRSCVEYAEKAAMHRHSMWSTLVVDVLLGNLIGCVWLMGNPAGFKLNSEVAGVLGMVSLNAIQICSTLWIFVGFVLNYIIQGLAITGILCGFTLPAALIVDMIVLATSHVSTLYWLISLLYSSQIQAVTALWRLFRGRKWNPLRQSIVDTMINLICISVEVIISVIHATPYIKFFLRLVRPGRFPSGIWFEILGYQSTGNISPKVNFSDELTSPKEELLLKDFNGNKSSILVSVLRSNYLSIGKVTWPHYKDVFSGFSASSTFSLAHGILIGRRIPYRRGTLLPSPMRWMSLPYREYWRLCHDSLVACFRV